MPQSKDILNNIICESESALKNRQPVRAYFDLDSTLFDVAPRVQAILEEYCKDSQSQQLFPSAIEHLKNVKITSHPYYLKTLMHQIGLTNEPKEFYKHIYSYWLERFFKSPYLMHDVPEKGAIEYVKELHQMGVQIIYLTGRDIPRMGEGTLKSLKKWGFPIEVKNAELILKAHHSLEDAPFKVEEFKKTDSKDKIWFFENEPVNIHLTKKETPHINIVYFDSVHSGKAPEPEDVLKISHFLHK